MDYKKGQKVRVTNPQVWYAGETGTVEEVFPDRETYLVRFGDYNSVAYFPNELEAVEENELEAVGATYEIELTAEDSVYAELDLTDAEAQTVRRVVDALKSAGQGVLYAPGITMKRKGA